MKTQQQLIRSVNAKIKHVFVLMLENRSYDHLLGDVDYEGTEARTGTPTRPVNLRDKTFCNCISSPALCTGNNCADKAVTATGAPFQLSDKNRDPGHEFRDTLLQLTGSSNWQRGQAYPDAITNSGFAYNYHLNKSDNAALAMLHYKEGQLPATHSLAKNFALCDGWHSSLPGPTWPNRFFVHAATSGGIDYSPGFGDMAKALLTGGFALGNAHFFDELDKAGKNWMIFHGDAVPQSIALEGMAKKYVNPFNPRFKWLRNFKKVIEKPGFNADYIFIEPNYGDIIKSTFKGGNSQHPIDNVLSGDRLLASLFNDVKSVPGLWEHSAFILLYDEHGGFFDHTIPPAAVKPSNFNWSGMDNNKWEKFQFDRLGIRVPAIITSPYTPAKTIDHQVYDHSSLLKTLKLLWQMPLLNEREKNANHFLHLLDGDKRTDIAPLPVPKLIVPETKKLELTAAGDEADRKNMDKLPDRATESRLLLAALVNNAVEPDKPEMHLMRASVVESKAAASNYILSTALNYINNNLRDEEDNL